MSEKYVESLWISRGTGSLKSVARPEDAGVKAITVLLPKEA
jgi:hypothetical protein